MARSTTYSDIHDELDELIGSLPIGRIMGSDSDADGFINPPVKVKRWGEDDIEEASSLLRTVRYFLAGQPDRVSGTYFARIDTLLEKNLDHTMSSLSITEETREEHEVWVEEEMERYTIFATAFLRVLSELAKEFPDTVIPLTTESNPAPVQPAKELPTMSVGDAAILYGASKKRIQNVVSIQKRSTGKDFDWVLRGGRGKGFMVDRVKFLNWMRKRPKRIGRPPNLPPSIV